MNTNKCSGSRNTQEATRLMSIKGWHGKFGHFNIFTLDHDSSVTGFGKHDRVMSSIPQFDKDFGKVVLYCRVDNKWGLGTPTEEQIIEAARQRMI